MGPLVEVKGETRTEVINESLRTDTEYKERVKEKRRV